MSTNGSSKPEKWPLEYAQAVGTQLIFELRRDCHRIEVAGSVRRLAQEVGDIELLVIPKVEVPSDLFGNRVGVAGTNFTDIQLDALLSQNVLEKRLNKKGSSMYGPVNKYVIHVVTGIAVDIFYTTPHNWGMAMVVRTGPKGFVQKVMTHLQRKGLRGHAYGGITFHGRGEQPCPTEEVVFKALGWPYIEPANRTG